MAGRAQRQGDVYKIRGSKTWVTHAVRADLMLLLVRTDAKENGHRGLSILIAEKPRGSEDRPFPAPGMTGSELARQIRQQWPDLPVILATGYAELPNGEDPGLPRLSKPYLQDELAAQIARVMSRAPSNVIPLDAIRRA